MKISLSLIILVILTALLCLPKAFCDGRISEETSMIHTGTGFAEITDTVNKEAARAIAIDAARLEVVRPLGMHIDARAVYSLGMKIADWNRIKAGGYIVKDRVVKEWQDKGGIWVTIEAWIRSGDVSEDLEMELLNHRRILLVSQGRGASLVETRLLELLTDNGYKCLDSGFLRTNLSNTAWQQLVNRDLYALDPEVFKFMADLVIHVETSVKKAESSHDMNWYDGSARISLFQLSGENKGIPLLTSTMSSGKLVTVADGDIEALISPGNQHPNSFDRQIAQPVVDNLFTKLSAREDLGAGPVQVTMTVTGIPSEKEYRLLKQRITHQTGVVSGSLRDLSRDGTTYRMQVQYRLKSVYLGYLLASSRKYRVTGHTWNTLDIAYIQSTDEVGHMENRDKIKKRMENLTASGKVGIRQDRLAELLAAPTEVPTLLMVLSDADTFYEHLTNDQDFTHTEVTRTHGPVKEPTGNTGISIAKGNIPGDLAMVRLTWPLVEKMAAWPCVTRIEESGTYHADKG
jgi:hypothetical protein